MTPTLFVPTLAEFQLTAARRRLGGHRLILLAAWWFQLTAARRRLAIRWRFMIKASMFHLTAARRRLETSRVVAMILDDVSTHSRPKAAGRRIPQRNRSHPRFNSQPPEGGWQGRCDAESGRFGFNSQPPEGGWTSATAALSAAMGFNSQPPEGGWKRLQWLADGSLHGFQLTAARRRLASENNAPKAGHWFQLTAARRRLESHFK